ncbi:MAG TPA: neuraminidase-like domain-containing protein [Candidatus Saccharimonadales bacterium]|nr:neuraminidase-like domain-containing protein [Candidatus Saccharimonadales bacterium]
MDFEIENVVYGAVLDTDGKPLEGLLVRAYARALRGEKMLGEAITDEHGKYEIVLDDNDNVRNSGDLIKAAARLQAKTAIAVNVYSPKKHVLLYASPVDEVHYRSDKREEINVTITVPVRPEEVEFEALLAQIAAHAGDIALADLQQDDTHQDLTFLARELRVPQEKLDHLVLAHRLQKQSGVEAPFFYALLRKNTLLKDAFVKPLQSRFFIDANADPEKVLYDVVLTDPKDIERDLQAAAKASIVSAATAKKATGVISSLAKYKKDAEAYDTDGRVQAMVDIVTDFIVEDKMSEVSKIFRANRKKPAEALRKLSSSTFLRHTAKAKDMETSLALGELLGYDQSIVKQVSKTQGIKKPEDVKRLARLNKAGWKEELTKSAAAVKVAGKVLNKRLVSLHASSLVRKMEKEFPTTAYAAQLAREQKTVIDNQASVHKFLGKHEDFDFINTNVDLFMKKQKLRAEEHDDLRAELKKVQRVFRLVPNYSKANALMSEGVASAKDITAVGKARFMKEVAPKAGLTKKEAALAYKKAENTATAAMLIVGDIQDAVSSVEVGAVNTDTLTSTLTATAEDFPNLKSLFKLGDVAMCSHCRSVYSPAAYLVEILEFLDNRSVTDLETNTSSNLAKDVLFERRPDLGEIDLSCDNANTPVPYIDLACELLEELIAPDSGVSYSGDLAGGSDPLSGTISADLLAALQAAHIPVTDKAQVFSTEVSSGSAAALPHYIRDTGAACKAVQTGANTYKIFHLRQTLQPAEELAAAPAYVNDKAYQELKDNAYAFSLPFDLHHAEAKAYFGRFDIDRAELMKTFQLGTAPTDEAIAAERLNLTGAEHTLIITAADGDQQDYWNTSTSAAADEMKVVETFLNVTGLKYTELVRLLALDYIDPSDNLFIKHLDMSPDTAQKEIAGLDEAALDRIHRFLRLQKKTGWKLETLNAVIMQTKLGKGDLDDPALLKAAELAVIAAKAKIKVDELIGCYGQIPYSTIEEDPVKPLYYQVFLNKAKNGPINEGLLPEAVLAGSGTVTGVAENLAVALQVKQKDFVILQGLLPDDALTFDNISRLLLAARLTRKLKLTPDEYRILTELTGLDPADSPADTISFIEAAQAARGHSLKLANAQFMLQHAAADLTNWEIKDETIVSILGSLQAAYQAAYDENKSPFDANQLAAEQIDALLAQIAKFSGVAPEDAATVVGFLKREWTTAATAKSFIDTLFAASLSTAAIKSAIDTLAAVPAADTDTIDEKARDLLEALMGALAAANFARAKQTALQVELAKGFKADEDLVAAVLAHARLGQPAPGTALLADVLQTDSLVDLVNDPPVIPAISEAAFGPQYNALRLLHKLLPFTAAFKLEATDAGWLLQNSVALGWLEADMLPYKASGHTSAGYSDYAKLSRMLTLSKTLTPVENPADAAQPVTFFSVISMTLPGSASTRAELLEKLALLTGYEQSSLDDIDAYFFSTFSLDNYRSPDTWDRMLAAAEYLRLLATDTAGVAAFIQPVLTVTEATALRMCLKSRYDEDTWLDTLKQVMDDIRPQKRNALVAYLLATRTDFKDTTDIYDHLLIDVEMEAIMPSSRIVQAHGTIQLFVQRCLMGLEPDSAANVDTDSGWEQWKWMKNYRVWEANRKVFLYPENWIEAELRDDKSFLFTEMENELQQNELTDYNAEQAFIKYLERLDDIAFLEIVATWYDTVDKKMHVFGRSKGGDPAMYYHRTFEQERYWTPWEKVNLEITGNHLLAFKRNNRLTLAWPIFSEEPDPAPTSSMPDPTPGTSVANEKPKRKLKIQLAVSEYANNVWQPKKVSKDAIRTPSSYTNAAFNNEEYTLMFFESGDQVWFTREAGNSNEICGIFDIAGCKGYPELAAEGSSYFPDFFPDFKDTSLLIQRYLERNYDSTNDLAVRNAVSPFSHYTILAETPKNFRITYPHQMTYIDMVALLMQYLMYGAYTNTSVAGDGYRGIKIPLGTLLPYFMEDSNHAYVITPGFYERTKRDGRGSDGGSVSDTLTSEETALQYRTGSDVLQLIEDIIALFSKYMAKLKAGQTPSSVITELLADEDYHDIVDELKLYAKLSYGEKFHNMYHPLICALRKTLYKDGVGALMDRQTQLQVTSFNFKDHYSPSGVVPLDYPIEDIDFNSNGSYSSYNWELFFHAPFYIATQLTKNQKFEEALQWFHYMFNPTGALAGTTPQKYWVTKPFYLRNDSEYIAQRIENLMYNVANPASPERKDLEFAIEEWREDPFKPHVVARYRTVAYQKALLMKYLNMLIEWGDYLFRQDTMESITQATQMYILADKLLGDKPRQVPPVVKPVHETYNQIERRLDAFGNALIDLENILPDLSVLPEGGNELPPAPVTLSTLYFCIPQNEQILAYWDTIADRLFKIRNSQNIDGIERSLALFAPPIDPGMLAKAAASGLSLSDILAGLNAPLPYYRFLTLAQKATELAQEVRGLGNSLLQALEKKDAEDLSLLRSELELKVLNAVKDMKKLQIQEAGEQIEVLKRTRKVTEERQSYYASIERISTKEQLNLDKLSSANDLQIAAQVCNTLAGVVAMVPDLLGGASGIGGSPHVTLQWGGKNLAGAAKAAGDVLTILSTVATYEATRAATTGGYDRRYDDWQFQGRMATKELASIDKQIAAAEIRKQVAETDLRNHEIQIDNANQTDEFMRSKFTNADLYQWMVGQTTSVYFSAYKLAHDFSKKAERSYQFELGRDDTFIAYGYWDSLKKGLLSADKLMQDLKRMEASYLDKNKREYEVVKHVSLAQLDPLALAKLKATGSCDFTVPEVLFDLDHAGQYFRRIKTVSISLPCVAGPYTSVSAKLSLVGNKYRKNTNPDNMAATGYAEDPGNDERFVYNVGTIQSVATSHGQKDSGLFELQFKDDRYLPFEGTGAISSWRLELPNPELAQFNYDTIADVIVHISYTAREGGSSMRSLAEASALDRIGEIQQELGQTGLHTAINLRYDMPNEWHLLKTNGSVDIAIDASRLPYLAQALDASIDTVMVLAKVENNPAAFTIKLDGADLNMSREDDWKLCKAETGAFSLGTPVGLSLTASNLAKLEELVLVVKYVF